MALKPIAQKQEIDEEENLDIPEDIEDEIEEVPKPIKQRQRVQPQPEAKTPEPQEYAVQEILNAIDGHLKRVAELTNVIRTYLPPTI